MNKRICKAFVVTEKAVSLTVFETEGHEVAKGVYKGNALVILSEA